MCGIAGFWSARKVQTPFEDLASMAHAIAHRGPDDEGFWFAEADGIGLAHRRLSIVDLSSEGHQPMLSQSKRYCISFNGEVYNFEELRKRLPRQQWKGHSDTEVMLAAIESWGLEEAVRQFVGMFAFVLWDSQAKCLHLVRDRIGIKPLYFGRCKDTLLFASELHALQANPLFDATLDRQSLAEFFRYNCIPAPHSIFSTVSKLLPGQIASFSSPTDEPTTTSYWDANQVVCAGRAAEFECSEEDALLQLESTLSDAIRLRMIADVPIGAFLSGGIDSSIVAAMMQAQSTRPIKTFTIGFQDKDYDEAPFAKSVARHLGTDHTELYFNADHLIALIPEIASFYDEPFADASQLPTVLISRLARTQVTVALSGDGGDELFGGYTRYLWLSKIAALNRRSPRLLRKAGAAFLGAFSAEQWDSGFRRCRRFVPSRFRIRNAGNKIHKLVPLLYEDDHEAIYRRVISTWGDPSSLIHGQFPPGPQRRSPECTVLQWAMYNDLVGYLPDDVLTKVDRASMSVGLEARVPLLDHRLVEFAWRTPDRWKVRDGNGKYLLRQLLARYVPPSLFERPKSGFGIPVGTWLRTSLRDWAESLLDPSRLHQQGYIDPRVVRHAWNEHLQGRGDWQQHLWTILMFQAWLGRSKTPSCKLNLDLSTVSNH